MVEPRNRFKPPLSLVMLDVIGTACLGLGLTKMYAGVDFLPGSLQFDAKGLTFIIIGVLLMLPMLLHLVAKLREQAEKKLIK